MYSLVLYKVFKHAATYFSQYKLRLRLLPKPALEGSILFLKTSNMNQQFFFISHAGKIPAKCSHIRWNTWLGFPVSILLANSIFDLESTVELLLQSEDQSSCQLFQYQLYVH